MKKLLLATALLTASTVTNANQLCDELSELAGTVMSARQNGVDMSVIMKIMVKDDSADVIGKEMTIKAYEVPRYSVEENKAREVKDFANNWYLACIESSS